jgi:hypothetical protein
MKKILFILCTILLSDIALAEGQLTFHPEHTSDGVNKYALGLSVYEHIAGPYFFNGWLGGGENDEVLGDQWFKCRNGLVMKTSEWKFEAGASIAINPKDDYTQSIVYGSATYKLW